MSIDVDGKRCRPVCDGCGKILPAAIGFDAANEFARYAHWSAVKTETGTVHYCPDCRMKKQAKRRSS